MSKLKELVIYDIDGDTVSRDTFLYVNELKEENEKLKQENEKLKSALGFYADHNSWQLGECVIETCDQEEYQGGKLARLTLKEVEESK